MSLSVHNLEKSFTNDQGEAFRVIKNVSFDLQKGQIGILLGPSGCGKTTLLRLIAGLEHADGGRSLCRTRFNPIPIHQRRFGFVFQDYALFPHKNVYDNVAFGLRMRGWTGEKITVRVAQVLELVGLAQFGSRSVIALSGGEQQRVALARALAPAPRAAATGRTVGRVGSRFARAVDDRTATNFKRCRFVVEMSLVGSPLVCHA
jgi:ABC-type Fe3+/spermidine/putrescine transport system ATPase subunit